MSLVLSSGLGMSGIGGGGKHNLGWFATPAALSEAHPTGSDGDYAIIGTTDTVWVWDTDSLSWIDTGQAGIELPDQTGKAGKFLSTNGTSPSWEDATSVTFRTWGANE